MQDTSFSPDVTVDFMIDRHVELDTLPRRRAVAIERPVFVVGCPRSGTTLVGRCLGGHPDLATGDESIVLTDFWRMLIELHFGANPRAWAPLRDVVPLPEFVETIGAFTDRVLRGFLRDRDPSRTRYVDHTPWYAGCIPLLDALYPDCRVVHVVRDGRDVVASLSRSYELGFAWCGATIARRASVWTRLVGAALHHGPRLSGNRYLEVRYETIERDPEGTLRHIVEALGERWHAGVLEALAVAHASPSRADAPLATRARDGTVSLRPRAARARDETWSDDDREAFARVAGTLQSRLGYV